MDYLGKPFGPMPNLLAIADYITKVHAICMHCGDLASHSHRTVQDDALVMLGEKRKLYPFMQNVFCESRSAFRS